MNRREAIRGLGALALGVVTQRAASAGPAAVQPTTPPLPSIVAGVRLVDSEIATCAAELSRNVSPPYLFNHAVRTFLFASLTGRALGQKFDEEVLYLACILHDLGLTERFEGDTPFEIQGAETAKHFLEEHAYAKEKIGIVWDGIAMHPSAIGQYKQPEIALVGQGAAADVIEPDFSQIQKSDVEEIVKAFPRLKFKEEFVKTCADVVRKHPRGASNSFMRDIRDRYAPEFHPRNFCDRVEQAPFQE
ncbi:MAG TPA: HD domain-containing protein [Terriglobales bacterium]|nr:HD domain-containing protein [Terriglobales bacterium]